MAGTVVKNLKLTKVVDGDTIKVIINDKEESLRFCCLDTEGSWASGSKPVTKAGRLASNWAKKYFGVGEEGAELLGKDEIDKHHVSSHINHTSVERL